MRRALSILVSFCAMVGHGNENSWPSTFTGFTGFSMGARVRFTGTIARIGVATGAGTSAAAGAGMGAAGVAAPLDPAGGFASSLLSTPIAAQAIASAAATAPAPTINVLFAILVSQHWLHPLITV